MIYVIKEKALPVLMLTTDANVAAQAEDAMGEKVQIFVWDSAADPALLIDMDPPAPPKPSHQKEPRHDRAR